MTRLSDYYESEYPEHSRTSCSDEHPINADVTGHGCWRCNAISSLKQRQQSLNWQKSRPHRPRERIEIWKF